MLDYLILNNKPIIKLGTENAIDLLDKTIDLSKEYSGQFLRVNEYYVARPDLISLAIYGDDKFADIICKINGISNPFELNEDMVLFIPDQESIYNILVTENSQNRTELLKNDDNISILNKVGAQKAKSAPRSPSEQIIGDYNYIVDKSLGIVIY